MKLREVLRIAAKHGIEVRRQGSGGHWVLRKANQAKCLHAYGDVGPKTLAELRKRFDLPL